MSKALKDVPVVGPGKLPAGLTKSGDNFYYKEFPQGKAITSLGAGSGGGTATGAARPAQQRQNDAIGDLIQSFNPTGGPPIRF